MCDEAVDDYLAAFKVKYSFSKQHIIREYLDILALDIIQKSLWISNHFGTENYVWRRFILQNFSCQIF